MEWKTWLPSLPSEVWGRIIRTGNWNYRDTARIELVCHQFQNFAQKYYDSKHSISLRCCVVDNEVMCFQVDDTNFPVVTPDYCFEPIKNLLRRFRNIKSLTIDTEVKPEECTEFDEELKSFCKIMGKNLFHCFDPSVRLEKINMWNEYVGLNLVSFLISKFADSLTTLDLCIETPEDVDVDLLWSSIELCENLQVLAYENAADEDLLNDEMLKDALAGKSELRELTLWGLDEVTNQGLVDALKAADCGENLKTFRLLMSKSGTQSFLEDYLQAVMYDENLATLSHVEVFVYRSYGTVRGEISPSSLFAAFPLLKEVRMVGPKSYIEPSIVAQAFLVDNHRSKESRSLRICCHPKFEKNLSSHAKDRTARWEFRQAVNNIIQFEKAEFPRYPGNLSTKSDLWNLNTRVTLRRGNARVLFDTTFTDGTKPLFPNGFRFQSDSQAAISG